MVKIDKWIVIDNRYNDKGELVIGPFLFGKIYNSPPIREGAWKATEKLVFLDVENCTARTDDGKEFELGELSERWIIDLKKYNQKPSDFNMLDKK